MKEKLFVRGNIWVGAINASDDILARFPGIVTFGDFDVPSKTQLVTKLPPLARVFLTIRETQALS